MRTLILILMLTATETQGNDPIDYVMTADDTAYADCIDQWDTTDKDCEEL